MDIQLIPYTRTYLPEILALFNHTIQHVNIKDYSPLALNQWIQHHPDLSAWHTTLINSHCLIAYADERVIGFGNITETGYLDYLYVHHEALNIGDGRLIYHALETNAKTHQLSIMTTDASITAVPFFEHMGFTIIRQQDNIRNGHNLINYRMEKRLL